MAKVKTNRQATKKRRKTTVKAKAKRNHPKFGTSKLEERFASDFLEKLGVEYVWQFEAKDIGRFYDFYLPMHRLLIEVDGSWYHSDSRLVQEDKMNPMQKRNKRVDKLKDEWALMHGIPLMRIWEKDINENPKGVLDELRERLNLEGEKVSKEKEKNKRHKNKILENDGR